MYRTEVSMFYHLMYQLETRDKSHSIFSFLLILFQFWFLNQIFIFSEKHKKDFKGREVISSQDLHMINLYLTCNRQTSVYSNRDLSLKKCNSVITWRVCKRKKGWKRLKRADEGFKTRGSMNPATQKTNKKLNYTKYINL